MIMFSNVIWLQFVRLTVGLSLLLPLIVTCRVREDVVIVSLRSLRNSMFSRSVCARVVRTILSPLRAALIARWSVV